MDKYLEKAFDDLEGMLRDLRSDAESIFEEEYKRGVEDGKALRDEEENK